MLFFRFRFGVAGETISFDTGALTGSDSPPWLIQGNEATGCKLKTSPNGVAVDEV